MSRKGRKTNNALAQVLESIPKNFDFGYCAVDSVEKRSFTIINTTPGILKFTIKTASESPFELSQTSGVLQVKGKQEVFMTYSPKQ